MNNNKNYHIVNAMLIPYIDFEEIISNNSWIVHPDVEGLWYEDLLEDEVDKDKVYHYLKNYFDVNKIVGVTSDDTINCEDFIILYE